MLLVVTYSQSARTSLRNVCRAHEATTVRRFGRAALFEPTEFGAFLALRLRAKHPDDVPVERTSPLNEFDEVPDAVREAASAYERRDQPYTPYEQFARGTSLPDPERMRSRELGESTLPAQSTRGRPSTSAPSRSGRASWRPESGASAPW